MIIARTLRELYKQIENIGNKFNTWEIPLDKGINLELQDDYTVKVNIEEFNDILQFTDSLSEEPASKDLEEAANQHSKQVFHGLLVEDNITAFKAGAEWQKQQIMKDALGAQVFQVHDIDKAYEGYVYIVSNQFKDLNLLPPNKVKIIIVKEK